MNPRKRNGENYRGKGKRGGRGGGRGSGGRNNGKKQQKSGFNYNSNNDNNTQSKPKRNLAIFEGGTGAPTCENKTKGRTFIGEDADSIYIYTCATDDGTAANGNLLSNQTVVE